ncbi:hypothetical protein NL676_018719, partial [Syzygium grande]
KLNPMSFPVDGSTTKNGVRNNGIPKISAGNVLWHLAYRVGWGRGVGLQLLRPN